MMRSSGALTVLNWSGAGPEIPMPPWASGALGLILATSKRRASDCASRGRAVRAKPTRSSPRRVIAPPPWTYDDWDRQHAESQVRGPSPRALLFVEHIGAGEIEDLTGDNCRHRMATVVAP